MCKKEASKSMTRNLPPLVMWCFHSVHSYICLKTAKCVVWKASMMWHHFCCCSDFYFHPSREQTLSRLVWFGNCYLMLHKPVRSSRDYSDWSKWERSSSDGGLYLCVSSISDITEDKELPVCFCSYLLPEWLYQRRRNSMVQCLKLPCCQELSWLSELSCFSLTCDVGK